MLNRKAQRLLLPSAALSVSLMLLAGCGGNPTSAPGLGSASDSSTVESSQASAGSDVGSGGANMAPDSSDAPMSTDGGFANAAPASDPAASSADASAAAPEAAPADAVAAAPEDSPRDLAIDGGGTMSAFATVKTRFGNQSVPKVGNSYTQGYTLIKDLGMNTIREGWNWKYIETGHNQYVSWMSMFDGKMNTFKTMGLNTMAMICDTPDWASSDPQYRSKTGFDGASLGKYTVPMGLNLPIFSDGTDVYKAGVKPNPKNPFAEYIYYLATRYKGKIGYYEVWNEPDFPSGDLTAGTRGSNGGTRYWTGSVKDYVRLLKVAHTIVKGIDPAAKVTTGGLGYENYLKAIIDNGGAKYFDVVDFHAYGSDKSSSNSVLNSSWGFLGRYNAMKAALASKGVTGKTFSCSETGFTANNPTEQARYVSKVFATAAAQGNVEAVQWAVFTNPGFNNIGLVDQATLSVKTAGYSAYKVASRQLTNASPLGKLTGTGVQGYSFRRADGKPLYVVWSTTSSATTTLPLAAGQVLDKFGKAKSASFSGGKLKLSLTADPVYVIGQ